jgi:hypothetical protein
MDKKPPLNLDEEREALCGVRSPASYKFSGRKLKGHIRMPTYAHEDVIVRFPDGLAGTPVSNLLSNEGTFLVEILSKKRGEVFSLLSPEYRIQMVIDDGYVAFRRNEYEVRKEIGRFHHHFTIIAKWGPDQFQLRVLLDDNWDQEYAAIETNPIYIPLNLVTWARRLNLLPRKTYQSPAEFPPVFLESLRQAGSTIGRANCFGLFWDRQRAATDSQRLVPKREPEAMSGVAALLQDQSLLAGYELVKESQAGAGSLDLRAVAPLSDGGMVNLCIESKNAHSPDLEHGIAHQLPTYMRNTNAAYGVYLVLWYRCKEFAAPTQSQVDLITRLHERRPWQNIIVEIFDLAIPTSPSDKSYEYV